MKSFQQFKQIINVFLALAFLVMGAVNLITLNFIVLGITQLVVALLFGLLYSQDKLLSNLQEELHMALQRVDELSNKYTIPASEHTLPPAHFTNGTARDRAQDAWRGTNRHPEEG